MPFHEIEFPIGGLDVDETEGTLFGIGALSITLVDRGDQPVLEPRPGEIRLWDDTLVRALFEDAQDPLRTLALLSAALGTGIADTARVRAVADQVWERAWLADWRSRRFGGRLWVCPTAAAPPPQPDAVIVRLDPGLAFGTGTHPTTALCLEAVESLRWPGRTAIDYGCGSGILAIAALKLGATAAIGVDLDPQALIATADNAARNGVAQLITVLQPGARLEPADVVMANILAGPLIELMPTLRGACKPQAELVLSGILENQLDSVRAAYQGSFHIGPITRREDWCCIRARRVT